MMDQKTYLLHSFEKEKLSTEENLFDSHENFHLFDLNSIGIILQGKY